MSHPLEQIFSKDFVRAYEREHCPHMHMRDNAIYCPDCGKKMKHEPKSDRFMPRLLNASTNAVNIAIHADGNFRV